MLADGTGHLGVLSLPRPPVDSVLKAETTGT